MNKILYFDHLIQFGNLYLEHVFFEFESEPILFTCEDEKKNTYLCLCSDIRYGQRWIITECTIATLKSLLEEKMDLASAFLLMPYVVAVDMDLQGKESSRIIEKANIDELDLPAAQTYLKCDLKAARNYLQSKEREYAELIVEKTSIGNRKIESYNSVIRKTVVTEKASVERSVPSSAVVQEEYYIDTEGKYAEMMDHFDVIGPDSDDYLHAA